MTSSTVMYSPTLLKALAGQAVHTLKAKVASGPVNLSAFLLVKSDCPNRTSLNAFAEQQALRVATHKFRVGFQGLRILTPLTPQWTSLHEYSGPEAWAILHTIPLDKEY